MKFLGVSLDLNDEGDRTTLMTVIVAAAAFVLAVLVGGLLVFL